MDSELDEKSQKLLGINKQLTTPGKNADVTEARQEALEILEEPERGRKNARQTMLMHKQGHGTGTNPEFPTKLEIQQNMQGIAEDVIGYEVLDIALMNSTISLCHHSL